MFDNKTRQQLESLLPALHDWEQSVPSQAIGFHRLRQLLQSDIEDELQRLFPRKAMVDAYVQRYRPLAMLAVGLDGLLHQWRQLEGELEDLLTLFAHEPGLVGYGENLCRQWGEDLRRLAARCEREADLLQAENELEQIGQAIRLHGEALLAFQNADGLLKQLGTGEDTAELESELSKARQAMAAGRVSLDGARQVKNLCASLVALFKRPEPPELHSLSRVLAEIRDWHRALGTSMDEAFSLEQRRRQLGAEWRRRDPGTARELLQEAESLRERLAAQGRALREGKLAEMEGLLADLAQALGPQPDIRQRLDALAQGGWDGVHQQPLDTPMEGNKNSVHYHKDWLEHFKEAEDFLKAIVGDQEAALEKRLRERCAETLKQLQQLQDQPLLNTLRRQAEALEQEAEQLGRPQEEAHDLLEALRRGNDLSRQAAALDAQARQDRLDLERHQRELGETNARLLEEAARLGCTIKNLAPLIKALGATASDWVLDSAQALAQSVAGQLDTNRNMLAQHCQAAQEALLSDIAVYEDALLTAGFGGVSNPVPAEPTELGLCADRLAFLAQERQALERQTLQALAELRERREQVEAELAALAPERLSPDERQEAEALLAEARSQATADQPLAQLRGLASTVEACAAFLERLSAEQQSWQSQLDVLKERLQIFKQERLHLHCSEDLLKRVADLAYGIPVPPTTAQAPQLREARALFERLERQAKRLTAQLVDAQLAELEQRLRNHPKPQEAKALLAEFRALGEEAPVPTRLRMRLQNAVTDPGSKAVFGQ